MGEPTGSAGDAGAGEDQAIRDQVRAMTSQVLQQGRVDPDALREVVRTLAGQPASPAAPSKAEAREGFAEAVRDLDDALQKSAGATHEGRHGVLSRGGGHNHN